MIDANTIANRLLRHILNCDECRPKCTMQRMKKLTADEKTEIVRHAGLGKYWDGGNWRFD